MAVDGTHARLLVAEPLRLEHVGDLILVTGRERITNRVEYL
jgi:hypothetical protein